MDAYARLAPQDGSHKYMGLYVLFVLVGACAMFQVGFLRGFLSFVICAAAFHYGTSLVDPHGSDQIRGALFYSIAATCLLSSYVGERRDRWFFVDARRMDVHDRPDPGHEGAAPRSGRWMGAIGP